jgi:hypothetical protein
LFIPWKELKFDNSALRVQKKAFRLHGEYFNRKALVLFTEGYLPNYSKLA